MNTRCDATGREAAGECNGPAKEPNKRQDDQKGTGQKGTDQEGTGQEGTATQEGV
jgi:hypothetical protein